MGRPRLGVALLAAGASRRFGETDKLAAEYRGRPLEEHAATAIPVREFAQAWVITARGDHPCGPTLKEIGFEPVGNPEAVQGMGTSVALAARRAIEARLDGLLIALADMPLVPSEHFAALIAACQNAEDIAVSAKENARMPPAIFGRDHFAALAELRGDTGARALLQQGRTIACPPEWLMDIDTPEDL